MRNLTPRWSKASWRLSNCRQRCRSESHSHYWSVLDSRYSYKFLVELSLGYFPFFGEHLCFKYEERYVKLIKFQIMHLWSVLCWPADFFSPKPIHIWHLLTLNISVLSNLKFSNVALTICKVKWKCKFWNRYNYFLSYWTSDDLTINNCFCLTPQTFAISYLVFSE